MEQLVVSVIPEFELDRGDTDWVHRNGDKNWTAGPPETDAVFKIQKIVMYYNPGS